MFPSGCYIVNAGFVWRLLTWRIQARRTTAFGIHLPVDEGCELQEREFLKTRTSGKPTCTRNSSKLSEHFTLGSAQLGLDNSRFQTDMNIVFVCFSAGYWELATVDPVSSCISAWNTLVWSFAVERHNPSKQTPQEILLVPRSFPHGSTLPAPIN